MDDPIHELADVTVNPDGYADGVEGERRAEERDKLEERLRQAFQLMSGQDRVNLAATILPSA